MKTKENQLDFTIPSITSAISLLELTNIPEATRQGLLDLDNLLRESLRRINQDISQRQGFIYEYLESYKFNQNAALKGESFRSFVTSSIKGNGTHPADIVVSQKDLEGIDVINKALAYFQLKSSSSHMYPAKEFFRDDYSGMRRITNPEHIDRIKELYEKRYLSGNIYQEKYKELLETLDKEISYKGVKSGGTSYKEVLYVTENTEKFVRNEKLKLYLREGGELTLFAAGTAFALTLATETIVKKSIDKESVSKALKSAGKTGAISSLSYILGKGLNNTPVVGAISKTIITGIESLHLVLKGEITATEGSIRVAKAATESLNSLYYAGVGAVVAGPVGAVLGGLLGYAFGHLSFGYLENLIRVNKIKEQQTKEAFLALEIFKNELRSRVDLLLLHLSYIEELIKEGNKILKNYIQTDDEKYLDMFCDLFNLRKIDNDEFERRFYSDKPLIL